MTLDAALLPVVTTVTDDEGLAGLAGEWDELLTDAPAAGIFLSWAWIASWRETLGRRHDLRIVVARHPEDGRLLGIAPFAVERRGRGLLRHRALVLLGSGPAAPDHLDLIVRQGYRRSISQALWSAACRRADWHLIDFDGVREDALLTSLLLRRRTDRDLVDRVAAPYAELPGSWEEFEAALGKNLRQNLRRYRRKLDREAPGPVVERLVVGAADVEETLEDLGRLHQQVRARHGDSGAFASAMLRSFHRLVALRLSRSGRLRLHRLDVDGRLAAAILCFRHGDTVSFYTTGYDPAWARYGPGRRILARAIAGAIDEGAAVFDFLRGAEAYKDDWNTETRYLLRIRRPVGPRGRLLWGARNASRPVRAWANRMR